MQMLSISGQLPTGDECMRINRCITRSFSRLSWKCRSEDTSADTEVQGARQQNLHCAVLGVIDGGKSKRSDGHVLGSKRDCVEVSVYQLGNFHGFLRVHSICLHIWPNLVVIGTFSKAGPKPNLQ